MNRLAMQRKIFACIMIGVVLLLVAFATWEMFRGNLAAAMSTFPVLVVVYLFVLAERGRRR